MSHTDLRKKHAVKSSIVAATIAVLFGGVAIAQTKTASNVLAAPAPAETVASFDYRPGNPSITPDGKILMTVHPLDAPNTKLLEVKNGDSKVYPSVEIATGKSSIVQAAIGIRTDDAGTAWVLDMPSHSLYAIDTNSNELTRTINIPTSVLVEHSFLQDFALDQKRNRIIIADMSQSDLKSQPEAAFVVVELESGKSYRVAQNHPSMLPEFDGGFALNPITIDPSYEFVYFGAMHGRTVYRVPAANFDNGGAEVAGSIEAYGLKPYSDGITVDGSGNVYVTDVEHKAFGVTNRNGYQIIATLPADQSWPDGMSFGFDGYIYGTVNQLDRSQALSGKETGTGEYLLMRFPAIAPGNTGR